MKAVQSLLPVFGLVAAANAMYGNYSLPVTYTTVTVDVLTTYWYGPSRDLRLHLLTSL